MEGTGSNWPCLAAHPEGVVLRLKISPNASKTQAQGLWQDRLRLRVQAPAVEGKANSALRRWLAKAFGVRSSSVQILKGEKGTQKLALIEGIQVPEAQAILDRIATNDAQ